MVRWRFCLLLAVLLLLPSLSKLQDADDDDPSDSGDADSDDGDDNDDESERDDEVRSEGVRRAPAVLPQTARPVLATRTTKKRPLECYVCAYKSNTPIKACLDPTKYRVQTVTCHSADDKCATSAVSGAAGSLEAVVRSCKSSCIGTPETTCCDLNRCNSQAFAIPTVVAPKALVQESNKTSKYFPPSVLFFVTILLVLQTVVKVTFV